MALRATALRGKLRKGYCKITAGNVMKVNWETSLWTTWWTNANLIHKIEFYVFDWASDVWAFISL